MIQIYHIMLNREFMRRVVSNKWVNAASAILLCTLFSSVAFIMVIHIYDDFRESNVIPKTLSSMSPLGLFGLFLVLFCIPVTLISTILGYGKILTLFVAGVCLTATIVIAWITISGLWN